MKALAPLCEPSWSFFRPSPPSGKLVVVYSAMPSVRSGLGQVAIRVGFDCFYSALDYCNYWLTTMVENQLPLYRSRARDSTLCQCQQKYFQYQLLRTPRERLGKSKFTYLSLITMEQNNFLSTLSPSCFFHDNSKFDGTNQEITTKEQQMSCKSSVSAQVVAFLAVFK